VFAQDIRIKDLPGGADCVDGRGVALLPTAIYYRGTGKSSEKLSDLTSVALPWALPGGSCAEMGSVSQDEITMGSPRARKLGARLGLLVAGSVERL